MDWMGWVLGTFAVILLGLIGALGVAIVMAAMAPTFSLVKADWNCTKSHSEEHLIMVGKLLMPHTDQVCDEYVRI